MPEGDKPGIFISHTSADARLANEVGRLVRKVFAGAIIPWFSSDKSPWGGIAPGEDWFKKLHNQLRGAAQVLAIVTPTSVAKPWIYWESGIGSVICPGRVAAVAFRVELGSLTPPLSYFQGVDGMNAESLVPALAKIGAAAELSPDAEILNRCVSEFVSGAEGLVAGVEGQSAAEAADPLAPLYGPLENIAEQLDRIERQLGTSPSWSPRDARDVWKAATQGDAAALQILRDDITRGRTSKSDAFGRLLHAAGGGGVSVHALAALGLWDLEKGDFTWEQQERPPAAPPEPSKEDG